MATESTRPTKDIVIAQGHSYTTTLRCEVEPIVRKKIKAITHPNGAALIQTETAHDLLEGWRVAITNVVIPREINAANPNRIRPDEYYPATILAADLIELNTFNIADFRDYTSGGFINYNTPADLADISIAFRIKDRPGGVLLASNLAGDGVLNLLTAVKNNTLRLVDLTIPVAATQLLAGRTAWYDVEAVSPSAVTQLASGQINVPRE